MTLPRTAAEAVFAAADWQRDMRMVHVLKPEPKRWYTVVGLWVEGELVVAGVIEGMHNAVDAGPEAGSDYQRYAESFWASDPTEAERLAQRQVIEERDG